MGYRLVAIATSLSATLWLGACGGQTSPSTSTDSTSPPANSSLEPNTTAQSDTTQGKKIVLTTFTVLADMAQNVAGDKLIVESITRIGAEIHGYEPTPSDLTKAQNADLILYNGLNLE
ncbi:MAG: zinc ABC transporter solute-binding protein, partial [Desertifilum sp. SIO1I2]|nr:zinc ABC transporter solute-binding protein [Desertifilum sp. SIO1I2]